MSIISLPIVIALVIINHIQDYQYRNFILQSIHVNAKSYFNLFLKTDSFYTDYINSSDNTELLKSIPSICNKEFFTNLEMEDEKIMNKSTVIVYDSAFSGKRVSVINGKSPYSAGFEIPVTPEMCKLYPIVKMEARVFRRAKKSKAEFVICDDNNGEKRFWFSYKIPNYTNDVVNKWTHIVYWQNINTLKMGDVIKVYFWSPDPSDSSTIYLDDIKVEFCNAVKKYELY
jgi:hypothetical protein